MSQREMNRILRPMLGIEWVLDLREEIDQDDGMVVVVYIENILIATRGCIDKHKREVSKVFQLLVNTDICGEINKCIFHAMELPFL